MSEFLKEETPVREAFEVDNDMKAEWCLKKIRQIRSEQQAEVEELTRQMKFYQDQMDLINKQADDDAEFFESMLRRYFAKRVDDGFTKATKTQTTYKLPTGTLKLKHQAPEFERDTAVLLPWLEQNSPDLVKVEKTANWAELKKRISVVGETAVSADGEVIPGVKVVEREDKFVVEV